MFMSKQAKGFSNNREKRFKVQNNIKKKNEKKSLQVWNYANYCRIFQKGVGAFYPWIRAGGARNGRSQDVE